MHIHNVYHVEWIQLDDDVDDHSAILYVGCGILMFFLLLTMAIILIFRFCYFYLYDTLMYIYCLCSMYCIMFDSLFV